MLQKPVRLKILLIEATVLLILSVSAVPAIGTMQMVALDVGEGQAILFEKNGHGLLVDTGPVHRAAELVRDINGYGVDQLDCLILTHLHPDHAGGLFRVLEEWPGVRIIENGHRLAAGKVPDLMRWSMQVIDEHERVEAAVAGDTIHWQRSRILFLWPEKIRGANLNRNSLVVWLDYEGSRVLIMGDVGTDAETRLSTKGLFDLNKGVDVLVAGHHGSKNTSSGDFLKKIQPEHAIICIDKKNLRGYPYPGTVKRLEKYSKQVHMTWNGDAVISLGQKKQKKGGLIERPGKGGRKGTGLCATSIGLSLQGG